MGPDNDAAPAKATTAQQWRDLHPFAKVLLVFLAIVAAAVAIGCAGGAVKWAAWVLLDWTPGK